MIQEIKWDINHYTEVEKRMQGHRLKGYQKVPRWRDKPIPTENDSYRLGVESDQDLTSVDEGERRITKENSGSMVTGCQRMIKGK